jgi:predicted XRE-type DNA-binding protein
VWGSKNHISDERKKEIGYKISKSLTGNVPSEETKEKLSKINAKLTKEQVIEIVNIVEEGSKTYREISELFGINQSCICDIVKKRTYKWVWRRG